MSYGADDPAADRQADLVEAYCRGRSAPTQAWLRNHPDWIIDPVKVGLLEAAHFNAVANGLQPDSDEYFASVERFIGLTGQRHAPAADRAQAQVGISA